MGLLQLRLLLMLQILRLLLSVTTPTRLAFSIVASTAAFELMRFLTDAFSLTIIWELILSLPLQQQIAIGSDEDGA